MTINYVNILGLSLENTTGFEAGEEFIVLSVPEHLVNLADELTPFMVDAVKGTVSNYWYDEARRRAIEEHGDDEETSEFLEELLEENEAKVIWDSTREDYEEAIVLFGEYGIAVASPEEMDFDI